METVWGIPSGGALLAAAPVRNREEERAADDMPEPDPEEAAICLRCERTRCLLDENRPCLRYRRGLRALRARRAAALPEKGPEREGHID